MPRPRRAPKDVVVELPKLTKGLPPPPPASLDPFLDAAASCFARYGIRRTSVQDVADAMRINRTTVYRQVGNVESMVRLLTAREMHRLLTALGQRATGALGPGDVVELLAIAVEYARAHPVIAKVVADEPELLGRGLNDVPEVLGRAATVIAPLLDTAMRAGQLARRDPIVVAEWLSRIGATVIVAPPPGDLRAFLREILVPALEVDP
jgi:AcrR family transcriptional regulator